MSVFTFKPFERVTAELLAGFIISGGRKDPTTITKRAIAAKQVGASLAVLAAGDAATALTGLQSALANDSLDPAVQAALLQAVSVAVQMGSIAAAVPLVGAAAQGVLTDIASGIGDAADAELAKYGPAPGTAAAPAPAPAPAAK